MASSTNANRQIFSKKEEKKKKQNKTKQMICSPMEYTIEVSARQDAFMTRTAGLQAVQLN